MIHNSKFSRVGRLSKLTKVEKLQAKLEDYFDTRPPTGKYLYSVANRFVAFIATLY